MQNTYSLQVPQAKSRILVVEDEEGILSLLEETLRIAGFEPITASTGAQALTPHP